MSKFYQNSDYRNHLVNKHKLISIDKPLYARSGLEITYFNKLDLNESVIKWGSECIVIPYNKPHFDSKHNIVTTSVHKYIVDVYVEYTNNIKFLGEIKPKVQIYPPQYKNKSKYYYAAFELFQINLAKWNAAHEFCKQKNYHFILITENQVVLYENHLKNINNIKF